MLGMMSLIMLSTSEHDYFCVCNVIFNIFHSVFIDDSGDDLIHQLMYIYPPTPGGPGGWKFYGSRIPATSQGIGGRVF